jgi:tryptophanyl-tRNA synthetase
MPESEKELDERPEANNLVSIYSAFADKGKQAVLDEFKGGQFSTFKGALAELVVSKLSPIAAEMRRLLADPAELDRLMLKGADQARAIAAPVMADVRRVVGWVT